MCSSEPLVCWLIRWDPAMSSLEVGIVVEGQGQRGKRCHYGEQNLICIFPLGCLVWDLPSSF